MEKYVKRPSRRVRRLEWKSSLAPWRRGRDGRTQPGQSHQRRLDDIALGRTAERTGPPEAPFHGIILDRPPSTVVASFVSGTVGTRTRRVAKLPILCQRKCRRGRESRDTFSFFQDQREVHRQRPWTNW